jgi:hypothetical protein
MLLIDSSDGAIIDANTLLKKTENPELNIPPLN